MTIKISKSANFAQGNQFRVAGLGTGGFVSKVQAAPVILEVTPITPGIANVYTFSIDSSTPAVYRTGRYAKYFSFPATAGYTVDVYMGPSIYDLYLNVFVGSTKADCILANLWGSSDDNNGSDMYMSWNPWATFTAPYTGTYVIEASTWAGAQSFDPCYIRAVVTPA